MGPPSLLRHLREGELRKWLTSTYVAMVQSTENSRIFSKAEGSEYDSSRFGGNDLAKNCMKYACNWLQEVKFFAKSEDVYEHQFLKPVRMIADYILKARDSGSTMSLQGWVFAKSEPYTDNLYGAERVTVSMVAPSLGTIMSIRLKVEDSDFIGVGFYEFKEVLPVPLVNRLRQSHPRILPVNGEVSLNTFDFLKAPFDDFEKFSDSIEMLNFCEIPSSQSDLRHRLGAAFVVACRIKSVRTPRLTVQGLDTNSSKTLVMSDLLMTRIPTFLDSLENKTARLLVVQWYDPEDEDKTSKRTEVFHVEIEDDLSNLRANEEAGNARLQDSIRDATLEKTGDLVLDEFLATTNAIQSLAYKCREEGKVQLRHYDVIDYEKLSKYALAKLLEKNGTLSRIVVSAIIHEELNGEHATREEICAETNLDYDIVKAKSGWLKSLGIAEYNEDRISITAVGKKAAYRAVRERIGANITESQEGLVSIPDQKTDMPLSFLRKFLEESTSGYSKVHLKNGSNTLFWTKTDSEESRKFAQERLNSISAGLLRAMRTTNYPFNAIKASEELRKYDGGASFFVVRMVLQDLEKNGILVRSGEDWQFPPKKRIESLLDDNPDSVYTADLIMTSLSFPTAEREKITTYLEELSSEGIAAMILNGKWTRAEGAERKSKKMVVEILRSKAVAILRSKRYGIDEAELRGRLRKIASDCCAGNRFVDRELITEEVIADLRKSESVSVDDGFWKVDADIGKIG